ncbi:hypothetical protein Sta7437_0801 [Stanieria cyanosphaera PCC 7437]|uniref:Uncharacterized protein n=1 Tax=Stanieria cyanosphaera (strain ATCC 29371 / PCC 7437) TaxID=111780 RepID=K9XQM3_STAC7|nr:hypothetical protein [Stanieria cyanosphaera]AFZ34389.1 hypothetical protein Sta7437_0801 [Stanieria cyanosphaera PCC 7437]
MNKLNRKLTATFALALTVGASTLAAPQRADAQVLELATGALNALFNRPPEQIPNRNLTFGTGNLNGNTFSVGSSPVRLPVPGATGLAPAPTGMIPSQGSISQTTVTNQVGTLPSGVVPNSGVPVPSGVIPGAVPPQVVQPTPPRPTVVIPPIKLPINLPL